MWGTITHRVRTPDTPARYRVIDGLAVRMVASPGTAPTSTRVLLSVHGIDPVAVSLSGDPDHVKGWLGWPVISLDIAKDGKSAKMELYDGAARRNFAVTTGLIVETPDPARVRGQLKTEIEKIDFDLHFDLAATSSCQTDASRCGSDPAP